MWIISVNVLNSFEKELPLFPRFTIISQIQRWVPCPRSHRTWALRPGCSPWSLEFQGSFCLLHCAFRTVLFSWRGACWLLAPLDSRGSRKTNAFSQNCVCSFPGGILSWEPWLVSLCSEQPGRILHTSHVWAHTTVSLPGVSGSQKQWGTLQD